MGDDIPDTEPNNWEAEFLQLLPQQRHSMRNMTALEITDLLAAVLRDELTAAIQSSASANQCTATSLPSADPAAEV